MAAFVPLQALAIHEHGAPSHGGAGNDVLAGCLFLKTGRRDNSQVGFFVVRQVLENALHATEVVNVAVGKENGPHRLFAEVFPSKQKGFAGRLAGGQRVHQYPPGIALDNRHVRQIVTPDLVEPVGDLEQPVNVVEGCLAPQAWIDRGRGILSILIDKIVGWHVPDLAAFKMINDQFRVLSNQSASRVLKIITIIEGSLVQHLPIGLTGAGRRRSVSGTVCCQ